MQTEQSEVSGDDISMEELEVMMMSFDDEITETEEGGDEISEADILAIASFDDEVIEVSDEDAEVLDEDAEAIAIEMLDADAGEVIEVDAEEAELSVLAKAMKAIQSKEIADEIYAEQESDDDHIEKAEKIEEGLAAHSAKKKKDASTPRATTFTHSRSELVSAKANPNFYLLEKADLELDEEGQKLKHEEVMALIKGMNVKGGAKCVNFLAAVNGTAKMSTFIESGVRYILDDNTITNADLQAYFMSAARNKVKAYNKSTAMPQALTLLKLFTDLKMLIKDGLTYKINENSLLIETLSATEKR